MTTIAYKSGVIAYDSQVTQGGTITDDDFDKRIVQDKVSFFMSGANSDFGILMALYFGDMPNPEGSVNATALVVDSGNLFEVGHNQEDGFWCTPTRLDSPAAIGSGRDHAITAMDMGADAKTAVKMAMKRDTGTGGRIRTYKIK